jgi:ribosomal protein S18 acetylase RimI-like enzyme
MSVRLEIPDIPRASDLLGRAFHADPFLSHLLPDPVKRARLSPKGFSAILRYGVRHGEVYATSPEMEGIAAWLPPHAVHVSLLGMVTTGIFMPFMVGPRFCVRFVRCARHLGKLWSQHAPFSHWYLHSLSVAPEHRHLGHASALLKPMLSRFDKEKVPCCLETMNGNNVGFYERFGFRVVAESKVPKTNLGLWLMARGS